jgi:DNA polymerase-1
MQNTLLLVDGSSYLYRAFHALPDLRGPDGHPTGAMHGMVNMLRRLRADYPAAYIACVFDAKGKTFRDDMYAEYKATRASMPPDLAKQIEPIHEVVRHMGWPILMVEGVEADDVIGTLAVQAAAKGMNTIVSTGDKDLAQLVNDKVMLINTMSNEKLDEAGVLTKFGVPPNRIIDYLTLIGDTVDNVPGVNKCGPKTALKWLALARLARRRDRKRAQHHRRRRRKPALGARMAAAGPQLITVKTDCDLMGHVVSIEESLVAPSGRQGFAARLLQRYGFKTMLRELSPGRGGRRSGPEFAGRRAGHAARHADHQGRIRTGDDLGAAGQMAGAGRCAELTSVDTETTSLDPMTAQMVGISLSVEAGKGAYIPVAHRYAGVPEQLPREEVLERMRGWLENPASRSWART